jgi:hypothetical protein
MPQMKKAARLKPRIKAMPVLGAAGLSLSLASGTSAAIGDTNSESATTASVAQCVTAEEQVSDISLATFHVPDDESVGPKRSCTRPIMVSQGACGADLYLPQSPSAVSGPVYQARSAPRPRPLPSRSKYKR